MRTIVASVVLAAAIAMPGIVVASTSSEAPSQTFSYTATIETPTVVKGPINPLLRPAVTAVNGALAAQGIDLTVSPLGGEAAEGFAVTPSVDCPIVVVFRLGASGGTLHTGTCSSDGEVETSDGLTITYTPASLGTTIDRALATLPGGNAG